MPPLQPPCVPAAGVRPFPTRVAGAALRVLTSSGPATPPEVISARTYTRLLAGETISWRQLLREHPLLGSITVAKLVDAGVVHVWPEPACHEDAVDFRLRMAPRGD